MLVFFFFFTDVHVHLILELRAVGDVFLKWHLMSLVLNHQSLLSFNVDHLSVLINIYMNYTSNVANTSAVELRFIKNICIWSAED